jgi:hypothetical protein
VTTGSEARPTQGGIGGFPFMGQPVRIQGGQGGNRGGGARGR